MTARQPKAAYFSTGKAGKPCKQTYPPQLHMPTKKAALAQSKAAFLYMY